MRQREKNCSNWAQFCVLCKEGLNSLYGIFIADVLSQIKIVVASSTYGGEERCIRGSGGPT